MNYLNKYNLEFNGLKEGKHTFEYKIDDKFFECFDYSEIKEGNIEVKVGLIKQTTLLRLQFELIGTVEIKCDRCLEDYTQNINYETELIVKFGHEAMDNGDEIIVIPFEEFKVELAHYLYEFIILALPIQRVHPEDENGENGCDPEMIDKLNKYVIDESESEDEEEPIDERWSELKKLLDNK